MLTQTLINTCQATLLLKKEELIERLKDIHRNFARSEATGDEADFGNHINEEHTNIGMQNLLRVRLLDIEIALNKIEQGSFGVCEETGEFIEEKRLLLMPWTKYSIEGAELLEANTKKFVSL